MWYDYLNAFHIQQNSITRKGGIMFAHILKNWYVFAAFLAILTWLIWRSRNKKFPLTPGEAANLLYWRQLDLVNENPAALNNEVCATLRTEGLDLTVHVYNRYPEKTCSFKILAGRRELTAHIVKGEVRSYYGPSMPMVWGEDLKIKDRRHLLQIYSRIENAYTDKLEKWYARS